MRHIQWTIALWRGPWWKRSIECSTVNRPPTQSMAVASKIHLNNYKETPSYDQTSFEGGNYWDDEGEEKSTMAGRADGMGTSPMHPLD